MVSMSFMFESARWARRHVDLCRVSSTGCHP
ncbi:putative leader peptide [Actinomycetes bacterium M1A6_2h]